MASGLLEPKDEQVRGTLTRLIAELGHAPAETHLAEATGLGVDDLRVRLLRLADAHALLLHPGTTRPWAVHPFALAPGSCWVSTHGGKGYWANCLYCALGIAAALRCDATVITRLGGEEETARYEVKRGEMAPSDHVFHLSTPPARWWDNVVCACSTFQPFRREEDIADWCARHDLPRGAVLTIPQLWRFAQDWYGSYLSEPWRKRSAAEVSQIFGRNGLTGAFWSLAG
jgi:Alkylmercury lyase